MTMDGTTLNVSNNIIAPTATLSTSLNAGNAFVGNWSSSSGFATFSRNGFNTGTGYGILHSATGQLFLNTTGSAMNLLYGGSSRMTIDNATIASSVNFTAPSATIPTLNATSTTSGNAFIGNWSAASNYAIWSRSNFNTSTGYAIIQDGSGSTFVNSALNSLKLLFQGIPKVDIDATNFNSYGVIKAPSATYTGTDSARNFVASARIKGSSLVLNKDSLPVVTSSSQLLAVDTIDGLTKKVPVGSNGQVLTVSGGLPTWQTPAAGTASSGVYTPTLSIISNLTSASVLSATYLKVDRIVHVSMKLFLQPTVAGNSTFATITLPFNSSQVYDAGNVTGGAAPTLDAGVAINNSATQLQISLIPTTTTNSNYFVTYQYQIP